MVDVSGEVEEGEESEEEEEVFKFEDRINVALEEDFYFTSPYKHIVGSGMISEVRILRHRIT